MKNRAEKLPPNPSKDTPNRSKSNAGTRLSNHTLTQSFLNSYGPIELASLLKMSYSVGTSLSLMAYWRFMQWGQSPCSHALDHEFSRVRPSHPEFYLRTAIDDQPHWRVPAFEAGKLSQGALLRGSIDTFNRCPLSMEGYLSACLFSRERALQFVTV